MNIEPELKQLQHMAVFMQYRIPDPDHIQVDVCDSCLYVLYLLIMMIAMIDRYLTISGIALISQ